MKREYIVPIDFIGDVPPDNEEIIRCKDCKHQHEYRTGSCPYYTTYGSVPPDNWYCADGQRAENARLNSSEIPNS